MTTHLSAYAVELYQHNGKRYFVPVGHNKKATCLEPKLWHRKIYAVRAAMKRKAHVKEFRLVEVTKPNRRGLQHMRSVR